MSCLLCLVVSCVIVCFARFLQSERFGTLLLPAGTSVGETVGLRLLGAWGVVQACGAGLWRGIQGLGGEGRREGGVGSCCNGSSGIAGQSSGGLGGSGGGGRGGGAITRRGGDCEATSK